MRFTRRTLAAAAAACLWVAPSAMADDLQDEVREMREMVRALQDKVEAQERQIEEQNTVLEDAGIAEQSEGLSAISSFLESTDFYGSVASSYIHDLQFLESNDGELSGTFPYDTYNTFQLDQLWFGMDKPVSEESRAGFHADIAFGANSFQGSGQPSDIQLWSAYVSYLAPIGNGIQIDAGDLWTLIGAEVVDTTANFNITRGVQWGYQPVSHVGVIARTEVADGLSIALGAVNDPFSDDNKNVDTNKAVTGQIAYSGDNFYAGVSGIYGSQGGFGDGGGGDEGDKYGMIDLLLTADPSDNLSLWFSYNYNWYEDTDEAIGFASSDLFVSGDDPELHSFGLAGRLAVTDTTGVAVRGELIVYDLDNSELDDDPLDADDEFVQWSLTATIDHALTDNLVAKFETRWDAAEERIFLNQNGNAKRNQLIAIAQLAYTF